MKRKIIIVFITIVSALLTYSCMKEASNSTYYANGIVTIRPSAAGEVFTMRLNDTINLVPSNIRTSPFDKEVRAYISFSCELPYLVRGDNDVYILGIEEIATTDVSEDLGEDNVSTYGDDEIEVRDSWETCVEDGYLTVRFGALWSADAIKHDIYLVQNPENPLNFTLYHNANNDKGWYEVDTLVAFRLPKIEASPEEGKEFVELTVFWKGKDGEKSLKLRYSE